MNYDWLDAYCLKHKGSRMDYKTEWAATRYLIGDKMFALRGTDNQNRQLITLKLDPENGDRLRREYKDIIPGYYMNKLHWNSIFLNGNVPDDLLKKMLDESYKLIFQALPKKLQKEISEAN